MLLVSESRKLDNKAQAAAPKLAQVEEDHQLQQQIHSNLNEVCGGGRWQSTGDRECLGYPKGQRAGAVIGRCPLVKSGPQGKSGFQLRGMGSIELPKLGGGGSGKGLN